MPRRRPTCCCARRLLAGLALVAHLLTVFGYPVVGGKTASQGGADPCRSGTCGCGPEQAVCCCSGQTEQHAAAECETTAEAGCPHCAAGGTEGHAAAAPAPGPRWVIGIAALRCKGQATLWVESGAALGPPPPCSWAPATIPVGRLTALDTIASSRATPPATPPPRTPTV